MPKILHIETTGKNCSVSISENNKLLCLCEEYTEDLKHSEKLHIFINWALEGAEISLDELQAVCVSKGPGSYTGLRIGVSAAKGLCYALDIPLIAVNTIETLTRPYVNESFDAIVGSLDARRNELFLQSFSHEGKSSSEVENVILQEDFFSRFKEKTIAFVGDGSYKIEILYQRLQLQENYIFIPKAFPSSKDMITAGLEKFNSKSFENVAYFEPFYLKPVHIMSKK